MTALEDPRVIIWTETTTPKGILIDQHPIHPPKRESPTVKHWHINCCACDHTWWAPTPLAAEAIRDAHINTHKEMSHGR